MGDKALKEEFEEELDGKVDDPPNEDPPADDPPQDDSPDEEPSEAEQYSKAEETARADGWGPREDWTGDPDRWLNPAQYNRFGLIFDKMSKTNDQLEALEAKTNKTLAQNNKFHEQQQTLLNRQIDELKTKRTEAIDLADTPAADAAQEQIDTLKGEIETSEAAATLASPPATPADHPAIKKWNEDHVWIKESTPRAAFAHAEFIRNLEELGRASKGDLTGTDVDTIVGEALSAMESSVTKAFPPRNANRDLPADSLRGRHSTRGRSGQLTMSDLDHDEKMMYQEFGNDYKDNKGKASEKEFLKAVASAREGV